MARLTTGFGERITPTPIVTDRTIQIHAGTSDTTHHTHPVPSERAMGAAIAAVISCFFMVIGNRNCVVNLSNLSLSTLILLFETPTFS